jgi:hypothetical protein
MGKRARDHRVRYRRDERYLDGRAKPEDDDMHFLGWNRSQVRSLRKWERQQGQLLFRDELDYLNWYHFNKRDAIRKGKR